MSGRTPLVAGNWKLHNTVAESVALVRALREKIAGSRRAEVAVAPVFTALAAVRDAIAGSGFVLAAQDVHWDDKGAFTGEVSAPLLADVGCTRCIVGHSERRHIFGESSEAVGKKTRALLRVGLGPIVCIGETLDEREAGRTLEVSLGQLDAALVGVSSSEMSNVVIAYEPVWAIGTGKTASPGDAQDVHAAVRTRLGELYGDAVASAVRILYGGSVKPENAKALLDQPDIDGALVGGASLDPDSFAGIVAAAG